VLNHLNMAPKAPSRVVVIGAGGFVGSTIRKQLEADGVTTLPLTRKELDLLADGASKKLKGLLKTTDSVVMVSSVAPAKTVPMLMQNVKMAEAVCAAFADVEVAHLVYISSDAVYADDAHPVRETSCCDPASFHGLMHLVRERALDATAKSKHIPYLIVRPSAIYGTGDTHNSYGPNRFVRTASRERTIKLFGNGEERRDHVHIDDVVNLIARCIQKRTDGILNIASGNAVPFAEVAQIISDLHGNVVNIQGSPRQNPITHRHFDTTRLLHAFPSFQFMPLRTGLAEMVKSEY